MTRIDMSDTCGGCGYEGDRRDFWAGVCRCGAECCDQCGEVWGDIDGNTYTCPKCLAEDAAEDAA